MLCASFHPCSTPGGAPIGAGTTAGEGDGDICLPPRRMGLPQGDTQGLGTGNGDISAPWVPAVAHGAPLALSLGRTACPCRAHAVPAPLQPLPQPLAPLPASHTSPGNYSPPPGTGDSDAVAAGLGDSPTAGIGANQLRETALGRCRAGSPSGFVRGLSYAPGGRARGQKDRGQPRDSGGVPGGLRG